MKVRVTDPASDELREIAAYLTAQSPRAAETLATGFESALVSLSKLPNRGRPSRARGTRELLVGSYVLIYRVLPEVVEVIRVRHHAQLR